jgi:predicted dehydrogenase
MNNHNDLNRRDFMKLGAVTSVGAALAGTALAGCATTSQKLAMPPLNPLQVPPINTVRVGFVGVGHQGSSHVDNFLKIDGVEIKAICDIVPAKVEKMQKLVVDAGKPEPTGYSRGKHDFERMCQEQDLDLVFTATGWEWHVPVCVAAMQNGKHAATEVPAALTVDECWKLVETAEKYQKHCVMMENCCYDRTELMIFNMIRKGLFGELLHAECGYLHDLRELKLSDFYEERWRIKYSIKRNADLYPTHGLGPVAQWMDINRSNQFDYLVSMSCNSRGLNLYAEAKFGANSPEAKQKYALGDVVNTLIRTLNGQTILVTHNTDSPRPYSRRILLQGTKGLVRKYPEEKIHIEGRSPAHHWENLEDYIAEYEHPLWKQMEEQSQGAGHGGMDFIEDYRLVQCLREGKPTDMNVYDAAALCAVTELSESSIARKSRPMDFPDFTRGRWKTWQPLGIIGA